ncbi:MAG TPA: DNA polymerase IV [Steroidobacteraceae bacterium]|jgi:DNA polymerase-4|nr:DNA polymerase IV [Steroidobacteraceae bacterium]
MSAPRAILHVDMDAFYASVEQRDRPELRGQPVIVGGTTNRGVVAAASYEVRKFGVRSAMPIREALRRCPHAICVKPRMSVYRDVSHQVFAIFHDYTPVVEGLSLDEAFLDVTGSLALKGDAISIARGIKQRIRDTTQLGASVGVAPNKLVAKIASDLEKPDGLTVITHDNMHAVLDPLTVRRLPGLGRKLGERVEAAGIATLGELRRAPDAQLWPIFGRDSQRMRERASGIDERPVMSEWDEKSISAEETFFSDLVDPARMQAEVLRLADRAGARMRAQNLATGCVQVKIRRADFTTFTRQRRFEPSTTDSRTIAKVAAELLSAWLGEQPRARVRLLGVGVNHLHAADQMDLFAAPTAAASHTALDTAVDLIRERFGNYAVRRGSALPEARGVEESRENMSEQAPGRRGRSSPPTRFEPR